MKLKIWARVGCTFELNCEPTAAAIEEALKEAVSKIPYAEGETYIPWGESPQCVQDENGNDIEQPGHEENPEIDVIMNSQNSNPLHEVAMIATIMGHNCFEQAKESNNSGGFIDTVDKVGQWAVEFYTKYKDFEWEQLYETPVLDGIQEKVWCWDDAIIAFAHQKINSLAH